MCEYFGGWREEMVKYQETGVCTNLALALAAAHGGLHLGLLRLDLSLGHFGLLSVTSSLQIEDEKRR